MHTTLWIPPYTRSAEHPLSRHCPYLDTIDRSVLDFDFEKLCSVTLTTNNVYACLVCGKYFQGEWIVHTTGQLVWFSEAYEIFPSKWLTLAQFSVLNM